MIDFIKVEELANKDRIRELLDFGMVVIEKTGEVPDRKRHATFKGLVFTLIPGGRAMKVQGSLHKFSNGGEKNNDRFTFDEFLKVAEELKDYISPGDRINVIEIGLNVRTPYPPGQFLNNLVSHKKRRFNRVTKQDQDRGEVEHFQYKIKIYNKGLQQGGGNILRVEVRVNKMQWFRSSFPDGLTWADLQKPESWVTFGQLLIRTFSEVVYYDPTIKKATLSPEDLRIIEEGNNPIYWENLNGSHQDRPRKRFQSLVKRHGQKFGTLADLLKDELRQVLPSKVADIYQNEGTETDAIETGQLDTMAESYPLLDCKNTPPPGRRYCPVTGFDITDQRSSSRFLSTTGIRDLMMRHPEEFDRLRAERLAPGWYGFPVEVQIKEIAHSVRNEYFNPRNNTRRAYERIMTHPALFDSMPYIRMEARVYLES